MAFFSIDSFKFLLQKYGYVLDDENDDTIVVEMYNMCVENIKNELKEAVQIGIVDADNKQQQSLDENTIRVVLNMMKIFSEKK